MNKMNIPLLQFAAGLMSPGQYGSFGGAMSRGLMGYTQGLQQQRENDMAEQRLGLLKASQDRQNTLADMQMSEYQRRRDLADETARNRKSIMTGLLNSNAASPDDPLADQINNGLLRHDMPSNPMIDPGRVRGAQLGLMAMGDTEGASQIGGMFAQPDVETKVINGRLVNTRTGEVIGEYAPQVNPLDVLNRDIVMGPDGPIVNPYKQQAEIERAKARRDVQTINNNVSVPADKKLFEGIGTSMGKSLDASREAALGAVSTINTVDQIERALDSGTVIAGPTAKARTYLLQLGTAMGLGGDDTKETLRQTRQAIQGMAQLELDAAKQMKGQGQITEAERAIIRRAAAGNIEEMTTTEIRELVGIQKKLARRRIEEHNRQVQSLVKNPEIGEAGRILEVPVPEFDPNAIRPDASDDDIVNFYLNR